MISIHVVSLIIGLVIGFIVGGVFLFLIVDKSMFFDERYWAGWGKGYEACNKVKKYKEKDTGVSNFDNQYGLRGINWEESEFGIRKTD